MLKERLQSIDEKAVPAQPEQTGKRTRYYLGKQYPGVYLTPQEAKCLFYSIKKFTSKKIGAMMDIHFRTVEYYRDNVRCKVGALSKKDLLHKIKTTHFIDYIAHLEKICTQWKKRRF